MLRLFLGLPPEATALPAEARVQPAAPALRARLLGLLCKSRAAADTFPGALQVCRPHMRSILPAHSTHRQKL